MRSSYDRVRVIAALLAAGIDPALLSNVSLAEEDRPPFRPRGRDFEFGLDRSTPQEQHTNKQLGRPHQSAKECARRRRQMGLK